MAAVDTVFEQLGTMTVLELVELKKKIEEEWGITAAAPVAVAAPGGGGGDGRRRRGEDVRSTSSSPAPARQKIQVIKVVRAITGLGLKEAKDLVDARAEAGQGRRQPGGGRLDQGAARRGRRLGRGQVAIALVERPVARAVPPWRPWSRRPTPRHRIIAAARCDDRQEVSFAALLFCATSADGPSSFACGSRVTSC